MALLQDGLAQFDASFVRDRTNYLIHLADAWLSRARSATSMPPAGALAAIDLVESLDSARCAGHLRDLCHQLKSHAQVPAIADFLERARGPLALQS